MPRPPRKKGESEASYFARVQKAGKVAKVAGKAAGKSPAQVAFENRQAAEAKAKGGRKPKPPAVVKPSPFMSGFARLKSILSQAGKKKEEEKKKGRR